MKENKICSTPGCGKPHHAKDKCHTCYSREIRNKKRNVTLRKKCKACEILDDCPDQVQKGSFKCIDLKKKSVTKRNKIRNKSVTLSPISPDQRPGTPKRNTSTHYFFYFCNYKGMISKGKDLKNGWYYLTRDNYKAIYEGIYNTVGLYNRDRWTDPTIKPTVSIQFTTANNTLSFGINHFNWPTPGAKRVDAIDFTTCISHVLSDTDPSFSILDAEGEGLRAPTRREIEHVTQPDKNVERHQEEGIGSHRGQRINSGHFTQSHPDEIQHDTEKDSAEHRAVNDLLGNPETASQEDTTNMAYDGFALLGTLESINRNNFKNAQSLDILCKGGANLETITRATAMIEIENSRTLSKIAEIMAQSELNNSEWRKMKTITGAHKFPHLWKKRT